MRDWDPPVEEMNGEAELVHRATSVDEEGGCGLASSSGGERLTGEQQSRRALPQVHGEDARGRGGAMRH